MPQPHFTHLPNFVIMGIALVIAFVILSKSASKDAHNTPRTSHQHGWVSGEPSFGAIMLVLCIAVIGVYLAFVF